jgi:hypothetical protein
LRLLGHPQAGDENIPVKHRGKPPALLFFKAPDLTDDLV